VVVLLHGGGQTRHSWRRTAERIANDGWEAITYDARGHGDSDWDAGQNYTLDAFVADLLEVVRMQPHPLVFVGASLGGITSLVAAAENPGLARGIVLVDVVVELDRGGAERIIDFLTAHRIGRALAASTGCTRMSGFVPTAAGIGTGIRHSSRSAMSRNDRLILSGFARPRRA
jgi:pimeloyl-ACP methyl ester carboxylesterase